MNRIDPRTARATLRQPAELSRARAWRSRPTRRTSNGSPRAMPLPSRLTSPILIDTRRPRRSDRAAIRSERAGTGASPGESADPIGDDAHSPVPGIVHRYPDRVLFKLVHVCAVYCRFCFRREMVGPGKATALSAAAYREALDYIARAPRNLGSHPDRRRSADAVAAAARRDHGATSPPSRTSRSSASIRACRWSMPARIDGDMIAALRVDGATTWVAVHANHPRELSRRGARGLRAAGRCRHSPGQPVGAAARRQRRCRDARKR